MTKQGKPVTGPDGDNPITDEQIRDLNKELGNEIVMLTGKRRNEVHLMRQDCALALGYIRIPGKGQKAAARVRVAAAWNARHGGR